MRAAARGCSGRRGHTDRARLAGTEAQPGRFGARKPWLPKRFEALGEYLQKLQTPRLGLVFFDKSDWFGDITRQTDVRCPGRLFRCVAGCLPSLKGFTGHFATESDRFARQYGGCLNDFIDARVSSLDECTLPALDP